jgi:xylulokinase
MGLEARFICVDAGTRRFKAALVAQDGGIREQREHYYPLRDPLRHEYHTGDFVAALESTLKPLTAALGRRRGDRRAGPPGGEVIGIGVTGHGPTLIPVDRDGTPLYPGVGYLDDRVKKHIKALSEKAGDRLTSTMYLPIALFFKEEQPEIYGNTNKFLQSFDYLVYLLTGEYTASASSRGIRPWDDEALRSGGLDSAKFPAVSYMGREIGRTTRSARERFGVPKGVPVYAVGVDFAAALAGAGVLEKGRSCERAGSSGGINLCWNRFVGDKRLLSYGHFIEGLWNVAGITSTSGLAVDWAACALGIERPLTFDCNELPKKILFFPYLKGERTPLWDPYLRGAFFGIRTDHTKRDLMKAVYLGITLGIRDCVRIIEENGCTFETPVVTTGWGAKDDGFVQFKADVTGKPFAKLQTADVELLGVAVVAAAASGLYDGLREAAAAMIRPCGVFSPVSARRAFYDGMFDLYLETQEKLFRHKLFDAG